MDHISFVDSLYKNKDHPYQRDQMMREKHPQKAVHRCSPDPYICSDHNAEAYAQDNDQQETLQQGA
jgi:hypothetical protein